ncbi:T9SS type A sorting domain-containing protein [Bacteroidota bacterium]
MKKSAFILTVIMTLGVVVLVSAQRPERGDKPERGDRSEMMHKMMQARTAFDAELTQDEKDVIAEFRTKLEAFRETNRENRRGERNLHDRGQGREREPGMKPFQPEEMKPLMEIAKNHKESLMVIFQDLKPQGEDRPEGRMHMGPRGEQGKKRGAVRFLLMDPAKAQTGMTDNDVSLFIYPNPAKDVINVKLNNETSQPVKIELYSKSGTTREVLLESTVPAGTQTYTFKIGHLPANEIYFIKTTVAQETKVTKLLKN